ncbi:Uu.00g126230.m01.CDS01 [Anthostomella pinea]|uniref:Uu.00g126230.m01.CDS01 n=1 Tax=Anthostomella pinea TaxID=933095 RepID=A0AAI8VIZ7_9PEZI|nr:Uu.00g126230.m01.CDS01 [Anthostomella pinea]
MSLAGKVALVTGASSGIGRATALRLGAEGATVVVGYGIDRDSAAEVVTQIGSTKAKAIQVDTGKVVEIENLVNETVKAFGKIDLLVPCAGIMPTGPLESLTEEAFDKTFNINVKGPLFLVQKAAPHMAAGSRIILLSTTLCHASTVMPHYLAYISSKGAIEQATRVLSKDLGKKGINVNCVAPGPTTSKGFNANQTEQSLKMAASLNPNGRIGQPEEIADTILFLCQDASQWVMGQTLKVNGGMA